MLTKDRAIFFVSEGEPVSFSRREREVLDLLIGGRTSKEIGYLLDIDPRTVDFYVQNMFDKTGTSRRMELLVWALRSQEKAA